MDEWTMELNSPITDEQWDLIADYDFDYTDNITFHTKHGKDVKFVKVKTDEWCTDCKEYDNEKKCCPRFNRVIRNTVQKTGKWILHPNGMDFGLPAWRCSECCAKNDNIPSDAENPYEWSGSRFCPNCGARMVEDD